MGKEGFRDLQVWRKAKDLAIYIYKVTNKGDICKDFGLRDQVRRAAISVASNIAEGDERDTNRESVRFLYIAKGSLAELLTQIIISREIDYIADEEFKYVVSESEAIGKMLGKLIKVRSKAYNL
ncbi:MAG: four helix bundle protein [Dissulfurispiraceae bacterium]|jgi:four helix bundle protein